MIKKINFNNIFTFNNEMNISFEKEIKIKDLNNYVVDGNNEISFLSHLIFYGENNSGKSNVIKAVNLIYELIKDEINLKEKYKEFSNIYLNDNKPISVEIEFELLKEKKVFKYGFSFNKNIIIKEYLFKKEIGQNSRKIFDINREKECWQVNYGIDFNSKKIKINNLSEKDLALRSFIDNSEEFSIDIFNNVLNQLKIMPIDNILFSKMVSQLKIDDLEIINDFLNKNNIFTGFLRNKMTSCPVFKKGDALFEEKIVSYFETENNLSHHLDEISNGVRKIINIFSYLFHTMNLIDNTKIGLSNENYLICIDEFDSSLSHKISKLLLERIIKLIYEKGFEKNIQFIFILNDATILDLDINRRDQIYRVKRDSIESSYVERISDIKNIRKDLKLSKAVLSGEL